MKKPPVKKDKTIPAANVSPEHIHDQQNASVLPKERTMKKKTPELNMYSKYSYFAEETLGLGRNGKRVAHAGGAAAGTWAAGNYGGLELVNNNLPVALAVGAGAGALLTAALDHLFIDTEQEALMFAKKLAEIDEEVLTTMLESGAGLPDVVKDLISKVL
jgi:hypothetical protein